MGVGGPALEGVDLEQAAAALAAGLARARGLEPMPEAVAKRALAEAAAHVGAGATRVHAQVATRTLRLGAWTGWATALAAAAALAAVWFRGPRVERIEVAVPAPAVVVEAPSPAEGMAEMMARVQPVALEATEHPLAGRAEGAVVWDGREQRGYLKVEGLAPVDPTKGVYQLWIFDRRRDERYPVDGGVFTVSGDEAVVVPIRAPLEVAEPTLFAVTLEPPGGVVVSDRKRILLAGNVGGP
jgi:anti-sigma-K factor RskA